LEIKGESIELERREQEERSHRGGNPHIPLALGVGFVVAAVLVILTAGTPAAGLPFVIAAAALLGKGSTNSSSKDAPFRLRSARSGSCSRPSEPTAAV
jgi:hypothetical protein